MTKNLHKVYVYGTLRPGNTPTVEVNGKLYDLGWYPGAILGGTDTFVVEVIEVDDDKLAELDRYEGYRESDPAGSLYIRRKYKDGWIYEYNQSLTKVPRVKSGDWLVYKKEREYVA